MNMKATDLKFKTHFNFDKLIDVKETDLRISNLVYSLSDDSKTLEVVEVGEIKSDYVYFKECDFDGNIGGSCFAIELTEEWLIAFGFIWNDSWGCFIKNGYFVEKIGDLLLDRKYGKVINYVHSLQNIYAIITDKELKLNK